MEINLNVIYYYIFYPDKCDYLINCRWNICGTATFYSGSHWSGEVVELPVLISGRSRLLSMLRNRILNQPYTMLLRNPCSGDVNACMEKKNIVLMVEVYLHRSYCYLAKDNLPQNIFA